jgi:ketosteroid isomerase-like protein
MKRNLYCLILVLAAAIAAPALAADSEAVAAMRAGSKSWVDSYNAGRIEPILAIYAADAVLMPPDAPLASGVPAIRRYLEGDIAESQKTHLRFVVNEGDFGVSDAMGWNSGTFKVVDGKNATVATGKFVEVWRKDHGRWLMVRDIWNMDPAPAPAK